MAGLTLRPISLGLIRHGGYVISYKGTIPAGASLWLGVPTASAALDVTKRDPNDLLNPTILPQFLALIGKQRTWWGSTGQCRLYVKNGHNIIEQSNEQSFACPVRPYVGRLAPELGRGDSGPPLKYTGTPPNYPDGRVLHMPAVDGCYYFAYGGKFETNNEKRGFNCITYAGAVLGVDVKSGAMSAYGTQLANHCGCVPCDMENKTFQEVKTFFARQPIGTYLMWSEHHVVLVVNAQVHEFRQKLGRYNMQPIAQWTHNDARWWVRRSPKQF